VNASTSTLRTREGLELFVRRWVPAGGPRRWTFVMSHGLGEHSGRYQHFAEWFVPRGASIYALDHRGHGKSGGPRGDAPSLDALLDDLDVVVAYAREQHSGPLVLFGHSFGGLIAIAYALERPKRLDRAVFSAPLLMVKVKVPGWKVTAGKALARVAPRMTMSNEVDPDVLSHDPEIGRAYRADPLVHNRLSAGMYGDVIARGPEFIARAPELAVPFLLLHGQEDRIVDPVGSERFFAGATARGRAFIRYPGMYHEIFNEVEQEKVFADIDRWLEGEPA
jgi:alpha-beta hydrolase superfamily lysophospholipase